MFFSIPQALAILAALIAVLGFSLWLWERSRLRHLHRQYAALAESAAELDHYSSQAVVTVDANALIRGYNPAAQALFGYEHEEIYGHLVFQLIVLSESAKQQTRSQGSGSYELPAEAQLKDGTLRPVLLHVTPLRAGPAPQARFFIEDLSQRQEHAQLEMENSLLWPTFDEAGLVIAMVDPDGAIIRMSDAGVRLLRLSDAEVEGRLFWEVFERPEDWDNSRAAFEQAKRTLGPTRLRAGWIAPDGSAIALDWLMLSPSWNDRNEVAHVVVTAALASDASLASQRQTLRMIERIAGRIAGHFENLLSTINGYSELVLHDLKPSSMLYKDVEQILAASERASESVRQLLGFSGCRLILPERVDLGPVLREDCDLTVLGNRKAIEEMLGAIREYSPAARFSGELVSIAKAEAMLGEDLAPGGYVKLSVALEGVTEEEVWQHLMEPFGSPRRGKRQAASVGLAMVHGVARGSGGGVSLRHREGSGVILQIWLPAAPPQAIEPAKPEPDPASAPAAS